MAIASRMHNAAINVLIIGGGITGLTLAIALQRHGIGADLMEIRGESVNRRA